MNVVPVHWTGELAAVVTDAVAAFARQVPGVGVTHLALDCHPWNGALGLALLTTAEAEADPTPDDPAEMAAWRHFHFTAGETGWREVEQLEREMRQAYEVSDQSAEAADAFLAAGAGALSIAETGGAFAVLNRSPAFRVSVAHPDSGRGFYPPDQSP